MNAASAFEREASEARLGLWSAACLASPLDDCSPRLRGWPRQQALHAASIHCASELLTQCFVVHCYRSGCETDRDIAVSQWPHTAVRMQPSRATNSQCDTKDTTTWQPARCLPVSDRSLPTTTTHTTHESSQSSTRPRSVRRLPTHAAVIDSCVSSSIAHFRLRPPAALSALTRRLQ